MSSQFFGFLSTKILNLVPLGAKAKNGLYLDTDGRFGFSKSDKVAARFGGAPVAITADGAVNPNNAENYIVTKADVALLTLAAPTATVDDGKRITVTSATAFAHTLTATNLFNSGAAANDLATFAAFAGASITLEAYQAKWNVLSVNAVVIS